LQNHSSNSGYNGGCCGLAVEYRRINSRTVRNENQFRVSFILATPAASEISAVRTDLLMSLDAGLAFSTIAEIGKLIAPGNLLRRLTRISSRTHRPPNPRLNAYLTLNPEWPEDAAAAEAALCAKSRGKSSSDSAPLHGNTHLPERQPLHRGLSHHWRLRLSSRFSSLSDAGLSLAENSGAVLIGKTNPTNSLTAHQQTIRTSAVRNPGTSTEFPAAPAEARRLRSPAGLCYGSIGTDTGGSHPHSCFLCGGSGLKPGLGPRGAEGAIPLQPRSISLGPMARTVADVALLFDAIAIKRNQAAVQRPSRPASSHRHSKHLLDYVSPEIRQAFESSLALEKLGAN